MNNLADVITRVSKPRYDPRAVKRFVTVYLLAASNEQAREVADALLAVLPPTGGQAIYEPLIRLGARTAFGVIRFALPRRSPIEDRIVLIRRASRLMLAIEIALRKLQGIGHLVLVETFRERLAAFVTATLVVRELAARDEVPSALRGAYVERLIVAAAYEGSCVERLTRDLFTGADRDERTRLSRRVLDTVPAAMANPYEPELGEAELKAGQDILLGEIPKAAAPKLSTILASLRAGALLDVHAPPQFLGALVRNPFFHAAADRLPDRLAHLRN